MSLTNLASLVHNERTCFAIVGIVMLLGWEEFLSATKIVINHSVFVKKIVGHT